MIRADLQRLLAKSSLLMIARIAGAALAFVSSILIARYFGAEVLGIVALSGALAGLFSLAASTGRQAVGTLFVSEYLVDNKDAAIRGFVRRGYAIIAAFSIVIFALFGLFAATAGPYIATETIYAGLFASLSAPALALINFNGGVLTGYRRQLQAMVPDLLMKPLLTLLGVAAVALFAPAFTTMWLLAAICLALWLALTVQMSMVWRVAKLGTKKSDYRDAERWRTKATPWIAIILLSDYLIELHLLLASFLVMPAKLAILHICFRMRMLASFGMRAIYAFILPEVYAAHARGDKASVSRDLTKGNILALIYTSVVFAGVLVFGKMFLGFFGPEFTSGLDVLLICCFTMIPRAIFGPATNIMAAAGRQRTMIGIQIIGVILSAATIVGFYPEGGILSIAYGYAVAITFTSIAQWWWTLKETGIDCSIFSALRLKRRAGTDELPSDKTKIGAY